MHIYCTDFIEVIRSITYFHYLLGVNKTQWITLLAWAVERIFEEG